VTRERLVAILGTWSTAPDVPAKVALALAILLSIAAALGRGRFVLGFEEVGEPGEAERRGAPPEVRIAEPSTAKRLVVGAALAAALLSIAYISSYLRGGPRIVDATTYFLQGRALAHGDLSWTPLDPSASFRGRFLVYREGLDETTLGGIFPPGYPLLLSFGFMLGSPMIVGPLLAAALVAATYEVAHAIALETHPRLADPIGRAAALLSVVCAALRHHTAETMSHGASALGIAVALACALRARRTARRPVRAPPPGEQRHPLDAGRGWALAAGLAVGHVAATRPVSAVPIAIVVAFLLATARRRSDAGGAPPPRLVPLAALAVVPGLLLLLLAQRSVTGSWLASAQKMYYTISDGPPGCFRWGFGRGTGCLHEHGEFVRARLPDGYGLVPALLTTLRRLHHHLLDVANLEPLALLVLVPLLSRRIAGQEGRRLARTAGALVGLIVLAYLPFYFDGDYPGGGARFYADVLPVEHALVAIGVVTLAVPLASAARPFAETATAFTRATLFVTALALTGFAIHASHEHVKLRERDGGKPMFEPDVLAHASVTKGLVFVETDHGFALGHDPSARPSTGVLVARLRSDDRDRLLFEGLERPPTWLYKIDPPTTPGGESVANLRPFTPPEPGGTYRFEAEAEWPPLAQSGGMAVPVWVDECASGRQALVLTPLPDRQARVTITVPVPSAGRWAVTVHVVHGARAPFAPPGAGAAPAGALAIGAARWAWGAGSGCATLPGERELDLVPPSARVEIEATGGPVAVDKLTLRKVR
jgi:hypothetical protein